jgi:signal transduction histidine kinase
LTRAERRGRAAASLADAASAEAGVVVQAAPDEHWLSGVAHDLNNALAILKGQVDLLRRRADRTNSVEGEQWRQGLQFIAVATQTLIRLSGELRDFGHLQSHQGLRLQRCWRDLIGLTRRFLEERQPISAQHRLCLETAEATIVGWWDAARLERALDNLLGNAIKYSPQGGAVTVRIAREAERGVEWVVLAVRDAGLGIAPADLPHIFQPGYRAAGVAGGQQGSGLGLAIARQIVEAHGGTITVASQLGRGSTFTVRLPLTAPAEGRRDESHSDGPSQVVG